MFNYLLNFNLSNFDPRKATVTAALLEEKKAILTPYQEFIFSELNQEKPFDGMCRIETQQMTKKCFHWLDVNKYQMTEPRVRSGIGKLLNQIGITAVGKSGRGAYYELPELRILQEKFSNLLGHSPNEIFD